MKKAKKAITPIISIIILLLIVMAIAAGAWFFLSGYYGTMTSKVIQLVMGSEENNLVRILNVGTTSINTTDLIVLVGGEEATLINLTSESIEPGKSSSLIFSAPVAGDGIKVQIMGPANTVSYNIDIEYNCKHDSLLGDIDNDGTVRQIDGGIATYIVAGSIPMPSNICCIDVEPASGDGDVDLFDVEEISDIVNDISDITGACTCNNDGFCDTRENETNCPEDCNILTLTFDNPAEDGFINTDGSSYHRNALLWEIQFGYGAPPYPRGRGYVEWDISSIPSDAVITNVVFKYHGKINRGDDSKIVALTANRPSTRGNEDLYNDIGSASAYADPWNPTVGTGQEQDLGPTAVADLQIKLTDGWFAIGLKNEEATSGQHDEIWAEEYSTGHTSTPPTLVVTYTPS